MVPLLVAGIWVQFENSIIIKFFIMALKKSIVYAIRPIAYDEFLFRL